jgi:hypothetical protein
MHSLRIVTCLHSRCLRLGYTQPRQVFPLNRLAGWCPVEQGNTTAHVESPHKQTTLRPTPQQRKAAQLLVDGMPIRKALVAAGYSDKQARKGIAAIRSRAGLCKALEEENRRWTPEARAALIRGRLIWNVIQGTDRGVRSAKLLGQEHDLSLWRPEAQRRIVVRPTTRKAADAGGS